MEPTIVRFSLETEYIELAKLLKATDLCSSGGVAKISISEGWVKVDGVVELRKGRKIRRGQKVELEGIVVEVD
ncbi:MAG: RNA-binding S4 domain-containing protein [Syntrophobacter sp.]